MKHKHIFWLLLACGFLVIACVPPTKNVKIGSPEQDFSQNIVREIYRLQNAQNFDSLAYFIDSENPMERFCATRAFGSFVTPKAVPLIKKALKDTIFEIRTEAAYVAGQLRDSSLIQELLAAFQADETQEVNHLLNKNILEAVGKIGSDVHLNFLSSSKPYPKKYDLLNAGKAHAYYQFALRGKVNAKATEQMIKFVTEDYPKEASLMAANYLLRAKEIDIEKYKFQLLQGMIKADDPNIRMCLASALGKTGSNDILSPFLDFLKKEKDSRVIINGIRQLKNFEYIQVIDPMLNFMSGKDQSVALAAANWLGDNGKVADYKFYLEQANKVKNIKVRRSMQGAVLKLMGQYYGNTRSKIEKDLKDDFESTSDLFTKRDIIELLGSNPYLFQTVYSLGFQDTIPIVRSKAVEMLGTILTNFLPTQSNAQKRYLAPIICNYMVEAMKSEDVGMIAAAASILASTEPDMISGRLNKDTIQSIIASLDMPKDIEAINYCIETINKHFPGSKLPLQQSDKLREFNLSGMDVLGKDAIAVISTNKGDIRIKLFAQHAPATVMNFVDLSQQGFYTDKYFHRVVPNFVIQAGCPRGDGYGSENYVIRSELSPKYFDDAGYIGMASAGKHTESTQWFITHSPTPHLNGNYTIFGKVEGGMDIVQSIEMGDKINGINIINDIVKPISE